MGKWAYYLFLNAKLMKLPIYSVCKISHLFLGLRKQDKTTGLRMSILQQVIIISSLLSFPITFVSMCIVDQHQKDVVVSSLIILFWILPPLTLYIGLHISKKYRNRDGHGISLGDI